MKPRLAIWGASGHALVVSDIIRLVGEYELVAYVDDYSPVVQDRIYCGLPVFNGLNLYKKLLAAKVSHVIIAIGDCKTRLLLAARAIEQGFTLATAIHPRSSVSSDVTLGAGSVIAAGAVVNPGAIIGENVIVNTCSSVDHECVIDEGAHICPGVHLAGKVHIGRASWIGIGTTIVDRVLVGSGTMIGAGSVVVCEIPDAVLAYGVPAKVIKRI